MIWYLCRTDYQDFGNFVANAPKEVKRHVLKWAADQAIRQQRRVVPATSGSDIESDEASQCGVSGH